MLAGFRAGYLHWYQLLHRDRILHTCPLLLPGEVSHPVAGWMLRVAVLLWMVASATVRMLYLTWDTHMAAGQRGNFPSISGSALVHGSV